jgi:ActR/RegA family two-component response regulator
MLNDRKLILLISHDAHARAILRRALEAQGFLVGEAANVKEGERTIRRVKPDAAIADLQMEIVEGGAGVIERLHAAAQDTLLYLATTGDAATLEFSLHALGVTGMFLKPVDAAIAGHTLNVALGLSEIV